ncbi:hypothetical protein GC163_20910 [bacterium]|nr:hypothetical protein [bacterium]
MSALLLMGLSGCLGRGETDLLQARLREQQQRLTEAESQLQTSQRDLKLARKETEGLRVQLAQSGQPGLLPEQSDILVRASAIKINTMLTAGFDQDDSYGDDSLVVHFMPVDDLGEPLRLPGDIEIKVLDPALPEDAQTIAHWNFTAAESREKWFRGLFGAGYQFTLPWKAPPEHSELVVHVQLKPADGRSFTASHIVNITPPVVTTDGQEVVPAGARATLKPNSNTRPSFDDSSSWLKDDVPAYR